MNKWIDVKDRLPEDKKYTKVLIVVCYSLAVDVGRFTTEAGEYDGYSHSFSWGCGNYSEDEYHTVTRWQPMIEPPKEIQE